MRNLKQAKMMVMAGDAIFFNWRWSQSRGLQVSRDGKEVRLSGGSTLQTE